MSLSILGVAILSRRGLPGGGYVPTVVTVNLYRDVVEILLIIERDDVRNIHSMFVEALGHGDLHCDLLLR